MAYFELTFKKSVDVRDKRLILLWQVVFCLAIAFNLWRFSTSRQWTRSGLVTSRLYVNVSPDSLYDAIAENRSGCPPHWHDFNEKDMVCPHFCALDQYKDECLPPMLSFQEFTDGSQSVFLSSAFGTMHSTEEGGIERIGAVSFFRSVDYLAVEFTYTYQPMHPPSELLWIKRRTYGSAENALTVILDAKGRAYTTFEPGEKILLSATELLIVAQFSEDLPVPGNLTVLWELPGWAHVHGVRLLAYVKCYNNKYDMPIDGFRPSTNRPSCLVTIEIVDTQASVTARVYGVERMTWGERRGVFVRSQPSRCSFRLFDLNVCLLNLTSALVLMGLMKRFVRRMLVSFLGTISHIYRRIIIEPFDIRQECAGFALRLMANSVSFVELADTFVGYHTGISRRRMSERLSQALRDRESELSEDEIKSFVKFCHRQAVVTRTARGSAGGAHDILYEAGEQLRTLTDSTRTTGAIPTQVNSSTTSDASQRVIDVDTFNTICSLNEHLDFGSMVFLFDKDRRRGFLERTFTPNELWRSIHDVMERQDGEEHKRDIGKPHHFNSSFEDRPSLSPETAESSLEKSLGAEHSSSMEFTDAAVSRQPSVELGSQDTSRMPSKESITITLEQEKALEHQAVNKLIDTQATVREIMQRGRFQYRKTWLAGSILQGHCERQLAMLQDWSSACLGSRIHDRIVALHHEADMLVCELAARKERAFLSENLMGERCNVVEVRIAQLLDVDMPGAGEGPTHASSSSVSSLLNTLELVCVALMGRASEAEAAAARAEATGADLRASLDVLMAEHAALFTGSGEDVANWDGHYYPEEEYVMNLQAALERKTARL